MQRTVFAAFVLCGALAGLAGFMFLARFGNITVVAGLGLELQSVAAVVVGGVNIFGGSGTVVGALLGTILIDLLEQSLIRWLVDQRILARRHPRPADPAGRGHRRGAAQPAARLTGPDRLQQQPAIAGTASSDEEAQPCSVAFNGSRVGKGLLLILLLALDRRQHVADALLSERQQHRQSLHALDREDHRGAGHDAGHHQRRDRSLGGVDHGAGRLHSGLFVGDGRADSAWALSVGLAGRRGWWASSTASGSRGWVCRRWP